MLKYLLYFILCIVIYRYRICHKALSVVLLQQRYIEYGVYFHP